jgi:hypothetical protein
VATSFEEVWVAAMPADEHLRANVIAWSDVRLRRSGDDDRPRVGGDPVVPLIEEASERARITRHGVMGDARQRSAVHCTRIEQRAKQKVRRAG